MPAPSKPTGTVQHKVYVEGPQAAALTFVGTMAGDSAVKITAKTAAATTVLAPASGAIVELLDCIGAGPVDAAGNPVSYTPFGSGVTKSVAGAAELAEFVFRFVSSEANALHAAMSDVKTIIGRNIGVIVEKKVGANVVYYWLAGEVSGGSVGFDTPAESEIRMSVSSGPTRLA